MSKGKSAMFLIVFLIIITACSKENTYVTHEIGESPDVPKVFRVEDLEFNLETGEIEGVDFTGKTDMPEMISILKMYYEDVTVHDSGYPIRITFNDGLVTYDSGHGELGNGPHQILLRYRGDMTIKDIKEKYGTPTNYEEGEGNYFYYYKYYNRNFWMVLTSPESDGIIHAISMFVNFDH